MMLVGSIGSLKGNAAPSEESITILFTNDLHDNFLPFEVRKGQEQLTVGGYARLDSAIKEKKILMHF